MQTRFGLFLTAGILLFAGAGAPASAQIVLESSAFDAGEPIPLLHSAYGDNVSPALSWSNLPDGALSLALILDDPDAPTPEPFVHWVIYNIPASATGLPEGLPADETLADESVTGATQGPSGLDRPGYFGPRPPAGPVHNYNFRLYALSSEPNLDGGLSADELREAISDDILGEATLIGTYQASDQ
ncbi:MAG: YbhB/YbcL family Raf kinase inhibitor-like protein [Gemmatimonas sp.]|nr:YbhB/YbcL family Raf kinase inhibitor-like protein [Gemmatimonas sp.]